VNDERLVSKMEGKSNFSRRLKQFDGLTCDPDTPNFTTDLRQCSRLELERLSFDFFLNPLYRPILLTGLGPNAIIGSILETGACDR